MQGPPQKLKNVGRAAAVFVAAGPELCMIYGVNGIQLGQLHQQFPQQEQSFQQIMKEELSGQECTIGVCPDGRVKYTTTIKHYFKAREQQHKD
eukprot:g8452.t1